MDTMEQRLRAEQYQLTWQRQEAIAASKRKIPKDHLEGRET